MSRFVDRVTIHVTAGNGGHGCSSVHREKFKPLGGPDGGNGGRGGDVRLVVDPQVHTLLDFHFRPHASGGNGKPGMGDNRSGANGDDLELAIPDGTVILDADGEILADMVGAGTTFIAAQTRLHATRHTTMIPAFAPTLLPAVTPVDTMICIAIIRKPINSSGNPRDTTAALKRWQSTKFTSQSKRTF